MPKKSETKPASVEIFYQGGKSASGKMLPPIYGSKAVSKALVDTLLNRSDVQATVWTYADSTKIDIVYKRHGQPDGAVHITAFNDIDRMSITVVGYRFTYADKDIINSASPSASRTLVFRHYKKRRYATAANVFNAAESIRINLNQIDDCFMSIKYSCHRLEKILR